MADGLITDLHLGHRHLLIYSTAISEPEAGGSKSTAHPATEVTTFPDRASTSIQTERLRFGTGGARSAAGLMLTSNPSSPKSSKIRTSRMDFCPPRIRGKDPIDHTAFPVMLQVCSFLARPRGECPGRSLPSTTGRVSWVAACERHHPHFAPGILPSKALRRKAEPLLRRTRAVLVAPLRQTASPQGHSQSAQDAVRESSILLAVSTSAWDGAGCESASQD
jgi:hypothetical protein